MKKFQRALLRIVPYVVVAAIVPALFLLRGNAEKEAEKRVLSVWNVDTFEGGKGSRASFLKQVAREAEREREGVYFLVASYTAEGARAALAEGNYPDILSFGVGLSDFAEYSKPLPYAFAGGELGGSCRAVPWCMGGYRLFSLDEEFSAEGETALSSGGSNLCSLAARLSSVEGTETESVEAYTGFLSGKYRYLLGTQRDVARFRARGVTVYEKPLPAYNDLFQYLSVLTEKYREDALAFAQILLSEKFARKLSEIGMEPVEGTEGTRTVSVFTDDGSLRSLGDLAKTGDLKILDKYLKSI